MRAGVMDIKWTNSLLFVLFCSTILSAGHSNMGTNVDIYSNCLKLKESATVTNENMKDHINQGDIYRFELKKPRTFQGKPYTKVCGLLRYEWVKQALEYLHKTKTTVRPPVKPPVPSTREIFTTFPATTKTPVIYAAVFTEEKTQENHHEFSTKPAYNFDATPINPQTHGPTAEAITVKKTLDIETQSSLQATKAMSGTFIVTLLSTVAQSSSQTLLQTNTESGLRAIASSAADSSPKKYETAAATGTEEHVLSSTAGAIQQAQSSRKEPPGFTPSPAVISNDSTESPSFLGTSTSAIILNSTNRDIPQYHPPAAKTPSVVVTTNAGGSSSLTMPHPRTGRRDVIRNPQTDLMKSTLNAITLSPDILLPTKINSSTVFVKTQSDNIIKEPFVDSKTYSELLLLIIILLCVLIGSAFLCLLLRRKKALKKRIKPQIIDHNSETSERIVMIPSRRTFQTAMILMERH